MKMEQIEINDDEPYTSATVVLYLASRITKGNREKKRLHFFLVSSSLRMLVHDAVWQNIISNGTLY